VPIVRKWGHSWLELTMEKALAHNDLTETELRRLHRCFRHPSVIRFHKVLQKAGHPVETKALEALMKVCHQCQINDPCLVRFRFTLHDNYEFNYEIIVDIIYLDDNRPMLYVIDTATSFNAARFLKDITTRQVWEALRLCWIDVYQGPPDWIVTDTGTQFCSVAFKQQAREMAIFFKKVPIEAHNSIGKVEQYHGPLRRAYNILCAEDPSVSPESLLQIAVKAINDTAGPDGIVPTLLVFGVYSRVSETLPPVSALRQRALAIQKATEAVCKLYAACQVSEALAARNGPSTSNTIQLLLQSLIRV
jgi:transposase InsO family protein